MLQLSAVLHDFFTVTRRSTSWLAAKLIWAKRPFSVLRDELYGEYALRAVTSRSKRMLSPAPSNTLPTLAYRMAAGAHSSGPSPPRLE